MFEDRSARSFARCFFSKFHVQCSVGRNISLSFTSAGAPSYRSSHASSSLCTFLQIVSSVLGLHSCGPRPRSGRRSGRFSGIFLPILVHLRASFLWSVQSVFIPTQARRHSRIRSVLVPDTILSHLRVLLHSSVS